MHVETSILQPFFLSLLEFLSRSFTCSVFVGHAWLFLLFLRYT